MSTAIDRTERILGGLWGAFIGDALGVPVEFSSREDRKRGPVTGGGYGTHNQPPILPIALRFANMPAAQLLDYAHHTSSLTHRHPCSQIACGFYCLMVAALLKGSSPIEAYAASVDTGLKVYARPPYLGEMAPFRKFVSGRIHELAESDIGSGGYVIDTLEASVWCMLNSSTFEEAGLKAVNLGGDTDTTGCVTGGLAGVHCGLSAVPEKWITDLPRQEDLRQVFFRFAATCSNGEHLSKQIGDS